MDMKEEVVHAMMGPGAILAAFLPRFAQQHLQIFFRLSSGYMDSNGLCEHSYYC